MSLLGSGDFRLHSGEPSSFKIDCDFLTDEDWVTAAALIAPVLGQFRSAVGVPRGGLAFAEALGPYAAGSGPILVVDDVWTTGGSLRQARREQEALGWSMTAGVVLFTRGPLEPWVTALFQLNPEVG